MGSPSAEAPVPSGCMSRYSSCPPAPHPNPHPPRTRPGYPRRASRARITRVLSYQRKVWNSFLLSPTDFYIFYKLHPNNNGNHFRRRKLTHHSPCSTDLCALRAARASKPEQRSCLSSTLPGTWQAFNKVRYLDDAPAKLLLYSLPCTCAPHLTLISRVSTYASKCED